jgi:hypothetical protein
MADYLKLIPQVYQDAHEKSFRSREQLVAAKWVGCFYCGVVFKPTLIKEWWDDGETAVCPVCGVDSVMPLTTEQFDSDFLEQMRYHWFDCGPTSKGSIVQ